MATLLLLFLNDKYLSMALKDAYQIQRVEITMSDHSDKILFYIWQTKRITCSDQTLALYRPDKRLFTVQKGSYQM